MPADEQLASIAEVTSVWAPFASLSAGEQQSLIDVSSQKILNFCRRGFIQENVTELHDGKNSAVLWLKRRPVISINQITVNGDVIDNTSGLEWTLNKNSGKLVRGNAQTSTPGFGDARFMRWWPVGTQNILVQYWAGYADVPDPIKRAVAFYCQYLRAQLSATGVFSSESIGDYSYTLNTLQSKFGIPTSVIDLIMDYVQDDGPI